MARSLADQEASEPDRPSSRAKMLVLSIFGLIAATVEGAKMQAEAMQMATRRRLSMDTHASSAVTGVIELLVGFIVLVFAVLIGFLLLPLVNDQSARLTASANTTAQQKSVIPIVGLVLVVALVIMALAFLFAGFKNILKEFK